MASFVDSRVSVLLLIFSLYSYVVMAQYDSWDWREHGMVTEAENQGTCEDCWSFAAGGAAESAYAIKMGELTSVSVQQIIDCNPRRQGCDGGDLDTAFDFIIQQGGVARKSDYPYTGEQGTCSPPPVDRLITISSYQRVDFTSEEHLMSLVRQQPVAFEFIVTDSFQHLYSDNRIYRGSEACESMSANHAMLLVGYGTTQRGTPYWRVKNSWGQSWGQNGFIRILRTAEGVCGMYSKVYYAVS